MSTTPTSSEADYGENYYATYAGGPYERNEQWLGFAGRIADRLVEDINPTTSLDAGCAMGFLVEALRDRGVEAYGVDLSEYALSRAREDIKPYLRHASLTEPLPQRYDLITCIEVLEHLSPEDAELAIANLCSHTDDIVMSSTPTEYGEASHINVQPAEYWAERFARQGFYRDTDYDATFLISWAVRFRRSSEPVHLLVKRYERAYARLQEETASRRNAIGDRDHRIEVLRAQLAAAEAELSRLRAEEAKVYRLNEDLSLLQSLLVESERRLAEITAENESMRAALDSVTWRLGQRLRNSAERVAPAGSRRGITVRRTARAALILTEQGPRGLTQRIRQRSREDHPRDAGLEESTARYLEWLKMSQPTSGELERMRVDSEAWTERPLVSIVMPVYNSPAQVLGAAIDSVVAQTYTNWELCIADDASPDSRVRQLLERYAAAEPRIKLVFRESNGGIAAASNSALQLATGELVAFLDHDDVLAPQALFRMVEHTSAHPEVGLIYSDEDKLRPDGTRADPFFKPDWSPDLFTSVNYVCHFTVIRRDLIEQVGGFREGYDGSQDYDLFLRVVDTGTGVGHVPDILYSWRQIEGSTAVIGDAKPRAYDAGRRAIEDSLSRRGVDGRVEVARVPTRYEVRRRIIGRPLVSIVIPTRDRLELLRAAIDSVERTTTYANYHILIVDNDSRDPATLEYLRTCGHDVLPHPGPFNYSKIVNAGVAATRGDHILLLNNDVEVIEPSWMEAMLEHSQRPEVGAVGARLLFPDGRPQHEGVGVGMGWLAGNLDHQGYFALGMTTRNCSAVTGACMMVPRTVWDEVGGLDETLHVAFNDVDFCLRIRERNYWIVFTPLAELYHNESASRGRLHPTADEAVLIDRWGTFEDIYDPFINANVLHFNPLTLRSRPKAATGVAARRDLSVRL